MQGFRENKIYMKKVIINRISVHIIILITVVTVFCNCSSGSYDFDEHKWRHEVENTKSMLLYAPNRRESRFYNPWALNPPHGFFSFLKWRFSLADNYSNAEEKFMPNIINNPLRRIEALKTSDFIIWIGHNSFLLRVQGEYWLTDPMFSERAMLPKRLTPPALTASQVNQLASNLNIIITHNHYDHLDVNSIKALHKTARIYVPRGLKKYMQSLERENVIEMDWWQHVVPGKGSRLICLPAQHWSLRLGQARNETLWASYVLITPAATFYIGGDSGYFIGYREFGKKFPGIDYAFMPVTAYHPRWFMHYAHMNVDEAITAFQDLGAKYFIPTQWGTFKLGDNPPGYPGLDLKRSIKRLGRDSSRFLIIDIGGIIKVSGSKKEGPYLTSPDSGKIR